MIIIKLKYSKLRSYCTVYTATPSHLRTYLKLHIQYTYTTHNQYTYESESESILWGSRSLNLLVLGFYFTSTCRNYSVN